MSDRNGDGRLECGPGEKLLVRQDIAKGTPKRAKQRRHLTTFVTLADFQLPDEESPLRGEWLDKCQDQPAKGGFRPHETVLAHMIDSHVIAANRILMSGGPALRKPVDFTFLLGDLAENQHYNEVAWVIRLMTGGTLDPDTGTDGYDGVQGNDPDGRGDITSPVSGQRILDLANEPFIAKGLKGPWYSVMGNHDSKVQGTVPDDMPGWPEAARAHALGSLKINDLAPDRQQDICDALASDPAAFGAIFQDIITDAATNPMSVGTTSIVPPDPNRRLVNKQEWIDAFAAAPGAPAGHGFTPASQMCPDNYGDPFLRRACYSFVRERIHYIVLDGNPREGLDGGNIDDSQWEWLDAQLKRSSRTYFDEAGQKVTNATATDRLIVVASHHPMRRFDNTGTIPGSSSNRTSEELTQLLLRFPNVILHTAGHSHENKIVAHEGAHHSYWEVNTAAIADWPSQSRTIEITENRDGTMSIFTVVFDAAASPDPRNVSWVNDDPTSETAAGLTRAINERWLASLGLETSFHDPQMTDANIAVAEGTPADRNAELLLRAPAWARTRPAVAEPTGGGPVLPATGGGAGVGLLIAAGAIAAIVARSRRRPVG